MIVKCMKKQYFGKVPHCSITDVQYNNNNVIIITIMHAYTHVFTDTYVNMYIDMDLHIFCVCMDINTHIIHIPMYLSTCMYLYMYHVCL